MRRIIQLDPLVSNQIAAGEVIERSASVVKELVENSIDAGATKIEIEVEGGGIHLIRVRDDGQGIVKEDLSLAFSRHATSKITASQDLHKIKSLGFRGEALASIASVSQCRLISKAITCEEAWQIHMSPEHGARLLPASHAYGTTIEVADLFYNTPVRRKFLRSERSETVLIEEIIKRLALGSPDISFHYKQNAKESRRYEKINDLFSTEARVAKIVGRIFMEKAAAIRLENEGFSLEGWIAHPSLLKRQADCQYLFVNRRNVKDRLFNHAIRMLYQQHPDYTEGSYPAYVLFLTIDPIEVDVNVHPTKQEVRFSQSLRLYDFISHGIRSIWFGQSTSTVLPAIHRESSPERVVEQENFPKEESARRYLVLERSEGIQIIDMHRTKEALIRCYFEHYKHRVPMRPLLFPLRIPLEAIGKEDSEAWMQTLSAWGWGCQREKDSVIILQQPSLADIPISETVFKILLKEGMIEGLLCICSENSLRAVDWEKIERVNVPSIQLSHADIAKSVSVDAQTLTILDK